MDMADSMSVVDLTDAGDALLRGFAGIMPTAVYACDVEGRITFFNERAVELWGRRPEADETDQRFCGSFRLWWPDGRALPHDQIPMVRAVREGISVQGQEVILEHPDGHRVAVLVNIAPLRDAEGRIVGAINSFADITERRLQEQSVRASEKRLLQRNGQLQLLARVSQKLMLYEQTENEMLTAVFGEVAAMIGAEMYFNYQPYDAVSMRLCNWGGLTDDERTLFETMRYGEKLCGRVAVQRKPVVVEDLSSSDLPGSETLRAAGYGAYAGFPLLAGNQLLGTIAFITRTRTHFTGSEVQTIQSVCDQVVTMLERKQLARELAASEERLRLALEGAGLGCWDMDMTSGSVVWDNRQYELQGYAPDSRPATQERWLERIHPEDAERVMTAIEHARTMRSPVSIEHRLFRADTGELRWLSVYGRFTYDSAGMAVRFSGVSQDITGRKQTESLVQVTRKRLETALEASQVILFHQDRELRYTWIHNPALGFDAHEVVGRRDGEIFQSAESAARMEAVKRLVLENGIPRREEVCVIHNGSSLFYDLVVQPATDENGDITGVNCAAIDITLRKRSEEALREADRQKDEFLATLAHELRNPLAPIRFGLEIIKLAEGDAEAIANSCEIMERQIVRMTRLLDDLLDLTRIAQGKIVLQKTRLRLGEALEDAVNSASPLIEERGHKLVIDIPADLIADPIHVAGDLNRLSQVFANLLDNSAKYTSPGGRIRLSIDRQGNDAIVSIEDDGVGIPEHMLGSIFNIFTQAERSSMMSQEGLGIGLNIVKRLVEQHGGSISVKSDGHGMGSRFMVRLPVVPAPPKDEQHHGGVKKPKPMGRRILIVDDNLDGVGSLAMLLRIKGNEIQTAHDGLEAVAAAEAFQPDVILMDIGMPNMNGYAACSRIRELPCGRDMVIVAQTGWGQEADRQKALASGFDLHLTKPIDPAALEKVLVDMLMTRAVGQSVGQNAGPSAPATKPLQS